MEFHPVQQRVVLDGTRVRSPAPQRLAVRFSRAPHVRLSNVANGINSMESTSMVA